MSDSPAPSEQQLQETAEACCKAMLKGDGLTNALDIVIERVAHCSSELSMTVQDWMTNGHKTCHGGMIFSLADSAFAYACNTENQPNVAASVSIDYLNAAFAGDKLTASAQKTFQRGRTAIYDVRVENQKGELIALFRGKSARIPGVIIPGSDITKN